MGVSSTALLACGALLLLFAADIVDCAEDFLTKTTEAKSVGTRTLIYSGAFTKQLRLLGPDASVEQLALTEEDVQFFGVAVDESTGDVYVSTSNSAIRRATYASTASTKWEVTTSVGGHVQVRVMGYNLGSSHDDIVSFSVRGVECSTMRRESSNSLVCVSGDPAITTDLGADAFAWFLWMVAFGSPMPRSIGCPAVATVVDGVYAGNRELDLYGMVPAKALYTQGIGVGDLAVQTATGGWTEGGYPGDFVDAKLADHSVKPIVTSVEVSGRPISPRAVCFDPIHRHLYFSDLSAQAIERVGIPEDGSSAVVEFDKFLPGIGTVYGIALDATEGDNGGFLYFSDTSSGTVSRVELEGDGSSRGAVQTLVSGLTDPMGVALEPDGGRRLFFTLYGGSIRAVARDGSGNMGVPQAVQLEGGGYEVRRFESGTRLDGIAISASESSSKDPMEPRLYWSESGRSHGLKRSSLDGTRSESILAVGDGTLASDGGLTWPRGLTLGVASSAGLLFCERLGSVRLLRDPAGGAVETVVESNVYPAAMAVETLINRAEKGGETQKYFMEGVM